MHVANLYLFPDNIEQHIAYMARVSNSKASKDSEHDKLISYLIKHQHWSPFEMVNVVQEIITTRSISRQLLRHRSFTFQEFSQRYSEADFLDSKQFSSARLQDSKNRQNSTVCEDDDTLAFFQYAQENILEAAREFYRASLTKGVAKELARFLLPEGLTVSRLYMNGTVRSWIHFCNSRTLENGAQREVALIATQARNNILKVAPGLKEAFIDAENSPR